ncbi:hypothetical protein [Faecalimicrobium dakarense]|uniref:hypothetical protein n=1 Tax=Faecalimicrobium dakarense TaxID=1301100 RepID=UPI0004BC89E8|nr:hypothetical protein [[Clostridium] dakarense]
MSFVNKCSTILRLSNKDICHIYSDKDLKFDYLDKDDNLVSSNSLANSSNIDFTNSYFDLDDYDNIYGIYKDSSLNMVELKKESNEIIQKEVLSFNYKKFDLMFPYIKKIKNNIHILYYVYNNNSTNTCALFHHYNHNGVWVENKVDFISHLVLNNFTVSWSNNCPIVYYFNLVNGYEEVFLSKFDINTLTWCNPIQITDSGKRKIYLSALRDSMNFYHLTFCEEVDNGYAVKYINGYLSDDKLDVDVCTYITKPSVCRYPSLIKHKSNIYLSWVDYERLNTCISNDFGKTWGKNEADKFSMGEDFTRANFSSNYVDDIPYNVTSVFTTANDIGILGF